MTKLCCYINLLIISLLSTTLSSFAENVGIYRAGFQGSDYNSFHDSKTISPSLRVLSSLSPSGRASNKSLSTLQSSQTSNHGQGSNGVSAHKNVIIGISAAAGVILVVIATVICIVCCRRRQRNELTKYTAGLYDGSQDQNSVGIYAEASIRLPSTSKSATVGSHSNPAYELGRDMSIRIDESRDINPAQLQFVANDSFVAESPSAPLAPKPRAAAVKQRGNMLVKYENVTVLADAELRPESVPDAERFYDNPGAYSPEYHVLENPEEVPSYGSYPAVHGTQDNSPSDMTQTSPPESLDHRESYTNEVVEPDEPIYMNSPVVHSSDPRDNTVFSFDVPEEELDLDLKTIDYDESKDGEDIYANSEAIRNSLANDKAADNPGYQSDDKEDDVDNNAPIDEPVYDNQSTGNVHTSGDSPLLNNQSDDAMYQDLGTAHRQESNYQSLSPVVSKKPKPLPKPKPKPQQ